MPLSIVLSPFSAIIRPMWNCCSKTIKSIATPENKVASISPRLLCCVCLSIIWASSWNIIWLTFQLGSVWGFVVQSVVFSICSVQFSNRLPPCNAAFLHLLGSFVFIHQDSHKLFLLVQAKVVFAGSQKNFKLLVAVMGVVSRKVVACCVKCICDIRKHIRPGQSSAGHVAAECCLCNTAKLAQFFLREAVFLH